MSKISIMFLFLCVFLLANPTRSGANQIQGSVAELTIGSAAPQLNIEHWVQDGNGFSEHINNFRQGKVYVIEFWATWCGPCIATMPHIVELQKDYRERNVQFISISDEDRETVLKFLARKVSVGTKDPSKENISTYADITKDYCLTADPDGSSHKDYMQAAEMSGVPAAFIIGKKGFIEWIGHPAEIDAPLEKVVTDSWDRDAFSHTYKFERAFQKVFFSAVAKLRSNEPIKALEEIDLAMVTSTPELCERLRGLRFGVLINADLEQEAIAYARELLARKDSTSTKLNELCLMIFEQANQTKKSNTPIVKFAIQILKDEVLKEEGKQRAALYVTLAKLYDLAGNRDEALAILRSIAAGPYASEIPEIASFLGKLESENAKK